MMHAADLKRWIHLPSHETIEKVEKATVLNKKMWIVLGIAAFLGVLIALMAWAIQSGFVPQGSRTFYPYAPMM